LEEQNKRGFVPEFKANKLEIDAQRNWDIFYKRNETRFFKDRHWTTREFQELLDQEESGEKRTLFEVGCGVGNLVFPLLEEQTSEEGCFTNGRFYFYACDFSPRAVDFVRSNPLYDRPKEASPPTTPIYRIVSGWSRKDPLISQLIFSRALQVHRHVPQLQCPAH